ITWATWPFPASSVRARIRSLRASAERRPRSITRSLGGGVSACQLSGWAQTWPSSTDTIRSTVTRGTPPALWKARPGALSISPSSAISLSSAFSMILSWLERPKARAISRLPAGWPDCSMKSRICWRVGSPWEDLRGMRFLIGRGGRRRQCRAAGQAMLAPDDDQAAGDNDRRPDPDPGRRQFGEYPGAEDRRPDEAGIVHRHDQRDRRQPERTGQRQLGKAAGQRQSA